MPKVLKELQLTEISLVDRPANEEARITVFKRKDAKPGSKGADPAYREEGADVEDEEDNMPDETKKVADLEKQVAVLTEQKSDLEKALSAQEAKTAAAEAKVAEITKARDVAASDEVLKVGDVEVRKSAVGDATFSVIKAQQAQIQKERDERELLELTKRAEADYGSLPGEPIAKAKALMAMTRLPEAERTALEAMLKSGNVALSKSYAPLPGGRAAPAISGNADEKLNALAKAKAEKESVNFYKAYQDVLETDEGRELYKQSLAEQRDRIRAN